MLREAGHEPFGYSFVRTHKAAQLHELFRELPNGQAAELEPRSIAVAGRVRARRVMGKLAFVTLEDDSGQIQLYVDKKQLDASEADAFKYARSGCSVLVSIDGRSLK